jgi:hypothetical protein
MLTITPAAKLRFQTITDVDIPEGWALRLDTPRMNHYGDTPGIAMCVGEPQQGDRPVEHEGERCCTSPATWPRPTPGSSWTSRSTPRAYASVLGRPRVVEKPAHRRSHRGV